MGTAPLLASCVTHTLEELREYADIETQRVGAGVGLLVAAGKLPLQKPC
jgi:hypothetical protein